MEDLMGIFIDETGGGSRGNLNTRYLKRRNLCIKQRNNYCTADLRDKNRYYLAEYNSYEPGHIHFNQYDNIG
jgi:hypothetical protein